MPRGPKGEKRPADVTGNAVKVMRIAGVPQVDGYGRFQTMRSSARFARRS
jgi:hypothetical protein